MKASKGEIKKMFERCHVHTFMAHSRRTEREQYRRVKNNKEGKTDREQRVMEKEKCRRPREMEEWSRTSISSQRGGAGSDSNARELSAVKAVCIYLTVCVRVRACAILVAAYDCTYVCAYTWCF